MRTQVAIVGLGPTGAALSALLGRAGVRHVALERSARAAAAAHPQAHLVNTRTMEVLRAALPATYGRVVAATAARDLWRRFAYGSTVTGREIARVDHFAGTVAGAPAADPWLRSACGVAHVPQNVFLPLLLDAAALAPHAEFRHETEVVGLAERPDGVTVSARAADGAAFEVDAEVVVAADGVRSPTRAAAGLGDLLAGAAAAKVQHIVNIHFRWPSLAEVLKVGFVCAVRFLRCLSHRTFSSGHRPHDHAAFRVQRENRGRAGHPQF